MTRPGIEHRSPGLLANTLTIMPMVEKDYKASLNFWTAVFDETQCNVNLNYLHQIRTHIFKPINKGNNLEHSRKKGSKPHTQNSRPHIFKPIKYFPQKNIHTHFDPLMGYKRKPWTNSTLLTEEATLPYCTKTWEAPHRLAKTYYSFFFHQRQRKGNLLL